MKTSQKKSLFIMGVMALIITLNFFIPTIFSNQKHLLFLGGIIVLVYFLLGIRLSRNTNDLKIVRNILIYVISYYLITYILGLFTGFARSVYSYKLSNLVLNIIPSLLGIIAVEIIRGELILKTNKNKWILVLSCILFVLFEVSVDFNAYNLYIKGDLYHFIGLLIMASITKNMLMTFIHTKTDRYPAIIYRITMETVPFLLLIEPNFGPYIKSVLLILLPVLISIMLLGMDRKVQTSPKESRKYSKHYVVIIIILSILVLLNSGFFKYQTLVIGSNSMYPYMERGDVVFIENTKDHKKLNVGNILVFRYDNKIVVHRITLKEKRDGIIYYKTKGDNNDQEDLVFLSDKEIKGKVLFRVKYIGLPSIWLSDLFD